MATLKTGTGIRESGCDASLVSEATTFQADTNNHAKIYALYRLGACNLISSGDFIWYFKHNGVWNELFRWHCPSGYCGYAYSFMEIDHAGTWDYKVSFQGHNSYFTIKAPGPPPEAEGQIIAHNINKLPCPNCGEANEGQEIEVIVGMKNTGDVEGEFRFYIYDQYGNELSREPDYTYKNVKAGDTWGVSKTITTNLNFDMINKTLNGTLKLVKQT